MSDNISTKVDNMLSLKPKERKAWEIYLTNGFRQIEAYLETHPASMKKHQEEGRDFRSHASKFFIRIKKKLEKKNYLKLMISALTVFFGKLTRDWNRLLQNITKTILSVIISTTQLGKKRPSFLRISMVFVSVLLSLMFLQIPLLPSLSKNQMKLELHEKQSSVFLSSATEILFGGAAGPGKSHLMRVAAISWCYDIPGLQVYLFRRTFDELWKNHMEGPGGFYAMLAEWVDCGFVKINEAKKTVSFKNGSKIFLCHCQHEKNVYKYYGNDIHVLMIDELTHFSVKMYRYLRSLVRLGGLVVPKKYVHCFPRILTGTNPGGRGHNWVKMMFVDFAAPEKIKQAPDSDGGMLRQFIPAFLSDNPTMAKNDPDYKKRLLGLHDSAMVRARLEGDWDIVAGGMFDDLWNRKIHVIKPFEIPAAWYVDRSFDWGSAKPFANLWWAESDGTEITVENEKIIYPRGTLFLIAEWYGWNGEPNEGCNMVSRDIGKGIREKEKKFKHEVKPGPADTSIFTDRDGDSIAKQMNDGYWGNKMRNMWRKANMRPGSRHQRWELLRERLKSSTESPMENPGIFIFNTCKHFIRTVPVLSRAENDPEDIDTDAEDHIVDAAGYRVLKSKSAIKSIWS